MFGGLRKAFRAVEVVFGEAGRQEIDAGGRAGPLQPGPGLLLFFLLRKSNFGGEPDVLRAGEVRPDRGAQGLAFQAGFDEPDPDNKYL